MPIEVYMFFAGIALAIAGIAITTYILIDNWKSDLEGWARPHIVGSLRIMWVGIAIALAGILIRVAQLTFHF